MLKTEIKKLENSKIEVKVTVPWKDWSKFIDQAVSDLSREIKISGFREGKVPRDIIEKKVGANVILEEAANKSIQKTYSEILEKEKIEAIGSPKAEILKIAEKNDLEYKITTSVMPEVKLGKYSGEIKKINSKSGKKDISVKDEDVKKEVDKIAQSRVKMTAVNREARKGDNVIIDFEVKKDGVAVEGGKSSKHPLILGSGVFVPGFEDNIIGMKAGEEKEFDLKFPGGYHDKNLAGNLANFWVRVDVVQERETPKVNDDFAKSLGKFENLKELEKSIRDGLEKEADKKHKESVRAEYIEKLVEAVSADIPEILIEEELGRMMGEFEMQLSSMGMNIDKYLKQMSDSGTKKTKEDMEKEWKPQAEKRIKASLALEKIAKDEEIEPSAEKIEEEMNKTLAYYKNIKDIEKNMDLGKLYNYIKGTLQNEEVFKILEKIN